MTPSAVVRRTTSGLTNGLSSRQERPKSAVFSGEGKVKMSVEEQMDRMRRHQSGSMKEKRRSLQLPASPAPEPSTRPAYKVVMPSQLSRGPGPALCPHSCPQPMGSLGQGA